MAEAQTVEVSELNHPSARNYSKLSLVYSYAHRMASACRHYRIEVPFRGFSNLGLASGLIDYKADTASSIADCMRSDVFLLYSLAGKGVEAMIKNVRGVYSEAIKKEHPYLLLHTLANAWCWD